MNSTFRNTAFGVLTAVCLTITFNAEARNNPSADREKFEHDRQSILSMVGTYKVTFDMRETVSFLADYQPIPAKTSGGHEVVKLIEDTGTAISLQHLLVVAGEEGAPTVVKHWRQSWAYEPREILVYSNANRWSLKDLSAAQSAGAWSQTVWQTDDSPRYGGLGRWTYDDGEARWVSDPTLRPLPRRDAVRLPAYNRFLGTNRHALTPTGWVHEQDNRKLGERDGKTVTFVGEVVINTYARASDFDVTAAENYWDKTQAYWAAVRGDWAATIRQHRGISLLEEAENGSKTGPGLMKLADRIAAGDIGTAEGVAAARDEIANNTGDTVAGAPRIR